VLASLLLLAPFVDEGIGHVFGIPLPWFGFIVWLLIGLVVYFLYGRRHSHVGKEEAGAIALEPTP
jgi:hypothetical protein